MKQSACGLIAGLLSLASAWSLALASLDKKSLDAEAYARWNNIAAPVLSDDGRWVAYTLSKGSGEQELVVHSTRDTTEFRVARGALPQADAGEQGSGRESVLRPTQFTADSSSVIFAIGPPMAEVQPKQVWQISRETLPVVLRDLGIMSLPTGAVTRIQGVSSFAVPKGSGKYLAYAVANQSRRTSTLVLRDLRAGVETRIRDVTQYVFDQHGRHLAYLVDSEQRTRNGAYVRVLGDGRTVTLLSGPGRYRSLTFDAQGEQLAFLSDRMKDAGEDEAYYALYHAPTPVSAAVLAVESSLFKEDLKIAPKAGIEFTPAGDAIRFNVSSSSKALNTRTVADREPSFELWHWKDSGVQDHADMRWKPTPQALSWRYVWLYHINDKRPVQLAGTREYANRSDEKRLMLNGDGHFAVLIDPVPYQLENTWTWGSYDLYVIDTLTGISQLIDRVKMKEGNPTVVLSPGGRYVVYVKGGRWWARKLSTGASFDITGAVPGSDFASYQEAIAGWTPNDRSLLIYDEYDIWEIDPSGASPARNLTDHVGRRRRIVFRLWEDFPFALGHKDSLLPRSEPSVNATDPLLLIAHDKRTMASGIWVDKVGADSLPQKLFMLSKRITPIGKATQASQYLLSIETFSEYPDLWVGPAFHRLRKISSANLQQAEYRWGTAELVTFTSGAGVALKGRLYKPDDFDSSKKYPMVVSIYGATSRFLHAYVSPEPMSAAADSARGTGPSFISKGFLYFVPDIETGASPYTGQSAADTVVPAVRSLISRGFVDPERIALMGHSYGGYLTNFIITQTELFRCAVSSAGLASTISAYGDPDFFFGPKYIEVGQPQHNGSLWERPFVYIANSPIFYADRVVTPLLLLNTDRDSAVPYSQGMQFFFGLRRNGKPSWHVNYRGENHNVVSYANRLDLDRRVHEFLDHYLKDAPMPDWMVRRE